MDGQPCFFPCMSEEEAQRYRSLEVVLTSQVAEDEVPHEGRPKWFIILSMESTKVIVITLIRHTFIIIIIILLFNVSQHMFCIQVSGCKCRKYLRRWRRWTLKARVLGRSHFDLTRILQLEVQRKVFVVLLGEFILAQNLRLFRVRREQQLKSLIFHKWARLTKWQCRSLAGASRIGSISSIRAKHDAFRQWTRFAGAHILKQGVLRFWRWRVERTLAIRLAVVRCHLRVPRLREALRTWKQVLVRRQQQRLAVGIFKRCEEKISRSRAFLSWKLMDHIQKGEGRGQKLWEDRRKKKVMETLISLMRIRGKKRKELQRAEMYYLHRSVQVSFFRLYTELGSGDFHGSSSSWRSLLEVSGWKRITRGEGEERQSG